MKMSDETLDFVCTACARENKTLQAVKYCVECVEYCCQSCTDIHKKIRILNGHNLWDIDVSQANQATSQQSNILTEFSTERCSIHTSKVMDMYCEYHDVVGCYNCFAKDHKSCQGDYIHSVPDMIDTLFKLSDCKQTHILLKDMIVSMEIQSKSKDIQLQALNKAKKEALVKVEIFKKALKAIIGKITESSKKEVEAVYKELEKDIIEGKHNVDSIYQDLQTTYEKLTQSVGNRAQHFVCSKLSQEKMKVADIEKNKQLQHNTDRHISFIPNQSLMEYIKSLHGIGQVKKYIIRKGDHLYKIRGRRNINIKLSDDQNKCFSFDCCLILDNQLLVTDCNNNKLKRIDLQKMSVVDYCTLDSYPRGVCSISKHEVVVACRDDAKIQFVSIDNTMTATQQIKMSHDCHGIAFKDDKLYVTDDDNSLYVYDISGTLLKTIVYGNAGQKLFDHSRLVVFNECGTRMFVGGGHSGIVCFDGMGNHLSTVTDRDLNFVEGVCVDGRGNMFVVEGWSHNVVQFSENGKKRGVVAAKEDDLQYPHSACFHQGLNCMFVTMNSSDVKVFELK